MTYARAPRYQKPPDQNAMHPILYEEARLELDIINPPSRIIVVSYCVMHPVNALKRYAQTGLSSSHQQWRGRAVENIMVD